MSAMTVLSIIRDICDDLELGPSGGEWWRCLQRLYETAYGSYHDLLKDLAVEPDLHHSDGNVVDYIQTFRQVIQDVGTFASAS